MESLSLDTDTELHNILGTDLYSQEFVITKEKQFHKQHRKLIL